VTRASGPGQEAVVAFMSDPRSHGGAPVEHIETHISHVFLAGDRAWKMKKDVVLDFADFGSLLRRRDACMAELSINRRTAPELYLGLAAVNRTADGLALGVPDNPVEYLVEMARFSDDALLDTMAKEGRLERRHIRAMADEIADLHAMAAVVADGEDVEDFETTVGDLCRRLVEVADRDECADLAGSWSERVSDVLEEGLPGLRSRARHGALRDGHGDLHLRNACVFEGRVRLFDAIEFEPRFRRIDVLYDLAFAVMDLLYRGHPDFAADLLSRYLAATRDYGGLRALPLFVSVRAAVRALVALLGPAPDRVESARRHLALATALLDAPRTPRLVVVGGRSGTGKSTVANALLPQLAAPPGAVALRSDEIRKRMWGVVPEERLPQEAYKPAVSAAVYDRMFRDARRALHAGAAVVLDATFLHAPSMAEAERLVARLDVPFTGVWLRGDAALLEDRIAARRNDASDADVGVLRAQTEPALPPAWRVLDAGLDADALAAAILELS